MRLHKHPSNQRYFLLFLWKKNKNIVRLIIWTLSTACSMEKEIFCGAAESPRTLSALKHWAFPSWNESKLVKGIIHIHYYYTFTIIQISYKNKNFNKTLLLQHYHQLCHHQNTSAAMPWPSHKATIPATAPQPRGWCINTTTKTISRQNTTTAIWCHNMTRVKYLHTI